MATPAGTWCDHCNRLLGDGDVVRQPDGSEHCPHCAAALAAPNVPDGPVAEDEEAPKAPWHFKLLLVGTVGYLIYRLIWFIGWISHHS